MCPFPFISSFPWIFFVVHRHFREIFEVTASSNLAKLQLEYDSFGRSRCLCRRMMSQLPVRIWMFVRSFPSWTSTTRPWGWSLTCFYRIMSAIGMEKRQIYQTCLSFWINSANLSGVYDGCMMVALLGSGWASLFYTVFLATFLGASARLVCLGINQKSRGILGGVKFPGAEGWCGVSELS